MAVERISAKQLKEIVARIAFAKASVPTACEGICSVASFWRRLAEDKDLQDEYARAREVRADARFESIDGVLGNLLASKIDAATARVMVDTIKWQAGREQPKRYAERSTVEHSGGITITITPEDERL